MSTISRAAVVEDGTVTNVILIELDNDGQPTHQIDGAEIVPLPDDSPVSIGYQLQPGRSTPPTFTAPTEPTEITA